MPQQSPGNVRGFGDTFEWKLLFESILLGIHDGIRGDERLEPRRTPLGILSSESYSFFQVLLIEFIPKLIIHKPD